MLRVRLWLAACLCQACMLHQSSSERLVDVASDLNTAARFGQFNTATEYTAPASREVFLERRQTWGNEIRVVDVSLGNINIKDDKHADVTVHYAWTRHDEGVLRNTSVLQNWENPEARGWRLQREKRIGGDLGLFGETVPRAVEATRPDVHFPTRSLGTSN